MDAAVSHLLKTCLSKGSKEQALTLSSPLSKPRDTSRLKKHITLLCDRLAKGGRLCLSTDAAAPPTVVMPGERCAMPADRGVPVAVPGARISQQGMDDRRLLSRVPSAIPGRRS